MILHKTIATNDDGSTVSYEELPNGDLDWSTTNKYGETTDAWTMAWNKHRASTAYISNMWDDEETGLYAYED